MAYAFVTDNTIQRVGGLPASARRLDTQEWVMGLDTAPADLVKATGWLPVVEDRPPLGGDEQHGTPAYTIGDEEVTAAYPVEAVPVEQTNERLVRERVAQALATLQTIIDTPNIPAGALTGAQLSNVARGNQSQVKDIARILRGVIRLTVGDFTQTD